MRTPAAVVLMLSVACASGDAPEPAPVPQAAPDPRIGELQTAMTELLERLDVLNDRIARLEEGGAVAASATASQPASAGDGGLKPAAPQREIGSVPQRALVGAKIAADYRNALMLYGRNNFAEARRGFEEVYEAEPSGDLADNALFWIGETYFAAKDFPNAMRFYARVTRDYADQNKAPDALFKTAIALERTGDLALARKTLEEVIARYPYSTPASSAKAELQRIRY
jgi:tol-pal system protein YbgF